MINLIEFQKDYSLSINVILFRPKTKQSPELEAPAIHQGRHISEQLKSDPAEQESQTSGTKLKIIAEDCLLPKPLPKFKELTTVISVRNWRGLKWVGSN